ncbi:MULTISPECIES: hypothetical protein [unclassified Ruegeria]|uniref:hypothetical protein n=1 Tax=unclassified Ruegeria TaxID=2625375 RepID=UPI001489173E|nr:MULTISPECIES: hypothetical protein [unclassified Ruegeria]
MGFRICYLASKAPAEKIADVLEVTIAESVSEIPYGDWWLATLKNSGWTIFWSENEEFLGEKETGISSLSQNFDTYVCHVNETVMWCSAEFWSKGKKIWCVSHRGDGDDIFDLTTDGPLPANFEELKDHHFANQHEDGEDVDHVFEIPLELAASEIDFRHDAFLDPEDASRVFRVAAPKKKGFLSRMFGG